MTLTNLEDFLRQWRTEQDARLGSIETSIRKIGKNRPNKEFYTCAEFAKLVNRAEYTVREWARLGRFRAEKTHGGAVVKPSGDSRKRSSIATKRKGFFPKQQRCWNKTVIR